MGASRYVHTFFVSTSIFGGQHHGCLVLSMVSPLCLALPVIQYQYHLSGFSSAHILFIYIYKYIYRCTYMYI